MKKTPKKTATKKKGRKSGRRGKKNQLKDDVATIAQILSTVALEIHTNHDHAEEIIGRWRTQLNEIHERWAILKGNEEAHTYE